MSKKQVKENKLPVQVAQPQPPAPFLEHDGAGAGLEGADAESYAIPFLRVLQSNSPQLEEGNAEFIEGAKRGQFIESVTLRLATEVIFLPCAFQRRFIRWAPRGDARGYIAEYTVEQVEVMRTKGEIKELDGRLYAVKEDGKINEKTCDKIVDTRNHFGLVLWPEGTVSRVLLTLASTQIKRSKQLLSMLSAVRVRTEDNKLVLPATWYNRVKLTTALESNDQGSWYGIRCALDGFITDRDVYSMCKEFHQAIVAGKVRTAPAEPEEGEGKGF